MLKIDKHDSRFYEKKYVTIRCLSVVVCTVSRLEFSVLHISIPLIKKTEQRSIFCYSKYETTSS